MIDKHILNDYNMSCPKQIIFITIYEKRCHRRTFGRSQQVGEDVGVRPIITWENLLDCIFSRIVAGRVFYILREEHAFYENPEYGFPFVLF